jgi:hypothetical protein
MSRSDAQTLVTELIAVDGAVVAAVLVFYSQAVSRFGGRMAARIWSARSLIVPAACLLGVTLWALVEWGRAHQLPDSPDRWLAPAALGVALLLAAPLVGSLVRGVIAERLPESTFRRLAARRFGRTADAAGDRTSFFDRAYKRSGLTNERSIADVLAGSPEPPPPAWPRRAWVKIRTHAAWRAFLLRTSNSPPDAMITEYAALAVRANDTHRVDQLARGVAANRELLDDRTYGAARRTAVAVAGALQAAARDASDAALISGLRVVGQCGAAAARGAPRNEDVAHQLRELALNNVDRQGVLNAAIEALAEIGNAGAYEPARNGLQDVGQHLIEQPSPANRVGDYASRAPEDSFGLLVRCLDELGGEESTDSDAHIARVCAYDVLTGAMPGQRSRADIEFFLWRITSLACDLAKLGSRSAGRAAIHAGQYIEKIGIDVSEGALEAAAETLARGGAYAAGRIDPMAEARHVEPAAHRFADALSHLPRTAVERGLLELRITSIDEVGLDIERFQEMVNV